MSGGGGEEVARNLRLAARRLARSPAFTLAAVLALGLCIGANTAIFSVVDAALLRPLPIRRSTASPSWWSGPAGSLAFQRFQATLLATLAGLALLLAAVGVYGLIASAVAERRRELGIRTALGATVGQAMWTVALPGVLLVAAGVALGCGLALLTVQALKSMIFGVKPTDPSTFLGVATIFLPALRVARLDPGRTLRSE